MDNRFNTIAGWTLGAGIVFLGAWLVTGEMFHAARPNPMGYPIKGVVQDPKNGGGEAEQPFAHYLQTADVARGQSQFGRCQGCHTIEQGGATGQGPNLWGRMGAPIAGVPGFAYSEALRGKAGETWTWDNMSAWIRNPRDYAPGTRMGYAGMSDPQDRADLLVFLNSKGGSLQIPPPPAGAGGSDGADAPGENEARAADAPAAGDRAAPQPTPSTQAPGKSGGEAAPNAGRGDQPRPTGH
jgi:cytochrome c